MSRHHQYENQQPEARRLGSDSIEERAKQIARSEGRTEISALDRIRAARDLRTAEYQH